jgi:hypothetical protein
MYPAADFEAWLAAQPRYSGTAQEKAALRTKAVTLTALDSNLLSATPRMRDAQTAEKRTAKAKP